MKSPILLEPVFQEKLWGGTRMRELFGYDIPSEHTGECWAISAHPNGDCKVRNPEYAGHTLSSLWREHRELFGHLEGEVFPLLIKIIDAKENLSIQVHPDDAYARTYENGALGKTECWYVLDCPENAAIIIGHNAESPEQLREMVEHREWTELLREVPIKKGSFFQIDPGCLHAIKAGTVILETQQSSDVTYRFYDYGRLENGQPRPLHIQQSLAVTKAPFLPWKEPPESWQKFDAEVTVLVRRPCYTVCRVNVDGHWENDWNRPFVNISVTAGEGLLDGISVCQGAHLLLPSGYGTMTLDGHLELICSYL
ncbi:MAG: class I mannose-6-phosphate isomerase [Oscillospiraceae bacterium]|nr:class I mannose-6-phosphate isomerase [Oscillospiraceae bacterium]